MVENIFRSVFWYLDSLNRFLEVLKKALNGLNSTFNKLRPEKILKFQIVLFLHYILLAHYTCKFTVKQAEGIINQEKNPFYLI